MNPSSDLSIVLLPAPLGPSRPTAPAANDEVTSRSARFLPYVTRHALERDDRIALSHSV